jgi:hypothetical protein
MMINEFIAARLDDPKRRRHMAPSTLEFLAWLNETHHIDGKLEGWYWLERRCESCKWGWMRWEPDLAPTVIGPEKGCPTIRRVATLFRGHPDFEDDWLEPEPTKSLWRAT